MNARRAILGAALVAGLAANTMSGVARIVGFHHRHTAELALASARLDEALAHLTSARRWQPDDGPTYILLGRVIGHAQANGLPLEALEDHRPLDVFGIGVAAVARGISLNPSDAWGWFNFGSVYQSWRSARVRLEAMRRAGEAARPGGAGAREAEPSDASIGLDPEDRVSVAATFKALELEPDAFAYHEFLAKIYWDRHLPSEAARELRESFARWPRLEAHAILERPDLLKGLADAILEGIDASASDPFAGPVMAARARAGILEKLGRIDQAIAAWETLKQAGDRSVASECDLHIGRLEIDRGRYRESLPALGRVLVESPSSSFATWALYFMGSAHSRLGERETAASFFRRHLDADPGSLPGHFALAEEEEAAGRSDEAERLYIAAVRKHPLNPVAYHKVVEQMRKHGKARQALSYAQALRKVAPEEQGTEALIRDLQQEAARERP